MLGRQWDENLKRKKQAAKLQWAADNTTDQQELRAQNDQVDKEL